MTDPWEIDTPFIAMFTDTVEIGGVRPKGQSFRSSFKACVFPPQKDEPFTETEADSKREVLPLMILKSGLNGWSMPKPPQIGDSVLLKNGSAWKVSSVAETEDWFQLEARSC